jgi:hypothetical protein
MIKKISNLTYVNKHRILNGNKVYDSDIGMLSVMVNISAKPSYELQIFVLAEFHV